MDPKFLGWLAFEPSFPIRSTIQEIADFQNQFSAEGYVTYLTYVTAGEKVSDYIGVIFSSEIVTEEEAQEAFLKFLAAETTA